MKIHISVWFGRVPAASVPLGSCGSPPTLGVGSPELVYGLLPRLSPQASGSSGPAHSVTILPTSTDVAGAPAEATGGQRPWEVRLMAGEGGDLPSRLVAEPRPGLSLPPTPISHGELRAANSHRGEKGC